MQTVDRFSTSAFASGDAQACGRRPMTAQQPHVRETGSGPGVVCLHANASSSSQWRSLMTLLAPKFHVLACDLYGAGKSPDWPSNRFISLRDEAAFIEPVLERAGSPLALVGHSHGAAVALIAALAQPERVRALALYEPTLFSLIDAESPAPNDAEGIRNAVADAGTALDAGDLNAAAQRFIDYWMEAGSWDRMPEAQQAPIRQAVTNVRRWAHALFIEPTALEAFRALDIPVLYMTGGRSTVSAHAVARLLGTVLPNAAFIEIEAAGHMGPVTHTQAVNEAIAGFLDRTSSN